MNSVTGTALAYIAAMSGAFIADGDKLKFKKTVDFTNHVDNRNHN